jgi:hypothetical protein
MDSRVPAHGIQSRRSGSEVLEAGQLKRPAEVYSYPPVTTSSNLSSSDLARK